MFMQVNELKNMDFRFFYEVGQGLAHSFSSSTLMFSWRRSLTAWNVSVFGAILVGIFPYSDWIRRDTEYLRIYSECRKIWTRITRNTDTFYAVPIIIETRFVEQISGLVSIWWDLYHDRVNVPCIRGADRSPVNISDGESCSNIYRLKAVNSCCIFFNLRRLRGSWIHLWMLWVKATCG